MDESNFEVGYFGDKRLQDGGALLMQRMIECPTVRLHALARDHSEEVRFGRFLRNNAVTLAELQQHCGGALGGRVASRHVLAIQDTTELNYQRHAGRTRGLGPVGNGSDRGLFLHPIVAVDAASGHCLGLVGAEVWTRTEEAKPDRHQRPIEDKESHRWLRGAERASLVLARAAIVTVIADRESDIYEEWASPRAPQRHLLTRAKQDRSLAGGGLLFAYTDLWPVVHHYAIELPRQAGKRQARTAELDLRFGAVTLKRPAHLPRTLPPGVRVSVVDVREVGAPPGEEPVHWRLLTTHAVADAAQAQQVVDWYRARWNIEQLFWTLKRQGFNLEASQLESADALMKLAFMATQAATRVMQLVRARDGQDPRPAEDLFAPDEIAVLEALQDELEGHTERQKNPWPARSLAWAAWTIARLGGWKGYSTAESPPGPLTMRRGLECFEAICHGYALRTSVHR